METTIMLLYIGVILWRLFRDNGKENGNYHNILGLFRDNGKENGNYHNIYWGYLEIMEKKMETTILYRDYLGIEWLQGSKQRPVHKNMSGDHTDFTTCNLAPQTSPYGATMSHHFNQCLRLV